MGAHYSVIGGGRGNLITNPNFYNVIAGGFLNTISGDSATVGGGDFNTASGLASTIPGGYQNTAAGGYSFAAGNQAKANHSGTFVWADSTTADFASTGNNQFLIRASGGVGIGTTTPVSALHVNGTITASNLQGSGSILMILTTNNQSIELKVNGQRALRLEPTPALATDSPNVIGGSSVNQVLTGVFGATISGGGGFDGFYGTNYVGSSYGTIGGGKGNEIQSGNYASTIGGGWFNHILSSSFPTYSTIAGGQGNVLESGTGHSTIGGGAGNYIQYTAEFATISGGNGNTIGTNADSAVIGGGWGNTIEANTFPTIGTGTIGGGLINTIQTGALNSTIAGGAYNLIQANATNATIGGGYTNVVKGQFAAVPGGASNYAGGDFSFAAGQRAKANHVGAFVWADSSAFDFSSTTHDEFSVRTTKGARFVTQIDGSGNPTRGVSLASGDVSWGAISDRNAKKNFQSVDGKAVLEKLAQMPVQRWNYKSEDDQSTPHIGPMAQDFKGAFYPGRDDKVITTLEFDGVELAAIQGLNQKLEERLTAKDAELQKLTEQNRMLGQRLEVIEKLLKANLKESQNGER